MKKTRSHPLKIVAVRFYREKSGNEPVRKWLKSLTKERRRIIGEDIKTVEMGWPLGMPLVKSLGSRLWEVRSSFPNGIARVIFTMVNGQMVLLHGFIKKSQKAPQGELTIARKRLKNLEN